MFGLKTLRKLNQKYDLRYWRFLLLYLGLTVVLVFSDVLVTRTTGSLSQAAVSMDTETLVEMLLWMALFTAGKILFDGLRTYFGGRVGAKSGYTVRESFAGHLTGLSFKELGKKSRGDVLSLYANDLAAAVGLLTSELLLVLTGIVTVVVSAGFMFRIHPLYAAIFFLLFPPLALLQFKISGPIQPLTEESSRCKGAFNGVVSDSLQNTSLVLAYGLQGEMEQRYLRSYEDYYRVERRRASVYMRLVGAGILATSIPEIFIAVAGAAAAVRGEIGIGQFVVLTSLARTANVRLSMLSQELSRIQAQKAGAARLLEGTRPEESPRPEVRESPARRGNVLELAEVSFSYDGANKVLDGVGLDVSAGANIAFVGRSGSGKSTLAKLILGLYRPDEGAVRRAGGESDGSGIDKMVAYVPQDSFLFPDTVEQNIVCAPDGSGAEEQDKLVAAAKAAGIHDFVLSLPDRYQTVVRPEGENLSGGQKQRIAIARALYSGAPVLLLDEATSSLDPATESAVLSEIDALRRGEGKTVITVAHRIAAVRNCDYIYLMDRGRIVESGPFDRLAREGTRFYELYKADQVEWEVAVDAPEKEEKE